MDITRLIDKPGFDPQELARALDEMSPGERRDQVLGLGRGAQRRLFDAADGVQPIELDFLVPAELPARREVVHEGRNTLPAFKRFAKVFCRTEVRPHELAGYNRTSLLLNTAVGPGYFVARNHEVVGELLVDYLTLPTEKCEGWPKIVPNSERLSRFVYHGTQDILRGVSRHVSIGRAQKRGKWLPAWFALVRQ